MFTDINYRGRAEGGEYKLQVGGYLYLLLVDKVSGPAQLQGSALHKAYDTLH